MKINRRELLAGTSTAIIALFIPLPTKVPLDTEALAALAQHVRTSLLHWDSRNQLVLFSYMLGRSYRDVEAEWLSEKHVVRATHLALQVSFRSLRVAAQEDGHNFPLMKNGRLTLYGQNVLMGLPLAPGDYDKKIFPLLDRLAPHYLG